MAEVVLRRAGTVVFIDLDVCAKSGRRTADRVELRGSTTPGWVVLLLLVTVIGFFLASAMTSRSYRVTLPLEHALHDRWRSLRRRARAAGLVGAGAIAWSVAVDGAGAVLWGTGGLLLVSSALVLGIVNARTNSVGFRTTRQGDLVLTRTHSDFARAAAAATIELVGRR